MNRNLFVFMQHQRGIGWMLLVFLLMFGQRTWGETNTFEFDGLTVTTDGVENTDYKKEDRCLRILTDKDFTFTAASTKVKIVVDEGVQNAHFTLSGYNCDRGEEWIGGPIIIEKNSSTTITLAEGTTNTIRGSWESETMLINDGASVTIDGTGSLTATTSREVSAGHGAAIQLNKTAKLTIKSGKITAISEKCYGGEGAAIGCNQFARDTACGTLIIDGGDVNLISYGNAAAFGGGSSCSYSSDYNGSNGGTLIVNGGKLTAQGRIGGGTTYYTGTTSGTGSTLDGVISSDSYGMTHGSVIGNGGAGGSITINGGEVSSTVDLGSAANATSSGSIKLVGGTLSTPSVSMADGNVSINQTMTLTDNFTTSLPVSVAAGAVVSIDGGSLNVDKTNITFGDGASISYLNAPTINDNYYEINTVAQLKWFRDLVNGALIGVTQNTSANAKLMADIDLIYEEWTPIGNNGEKSYSGVFDGNFHTISNLKVEGVDFCGFIGVAENGTIKNLGVINAEIAGGRSRVGVIVGSTNDVTIRNCWSSGTLNLSVTAGVCVAGIANTFYGKVTNCHTSYSTAVVDIAAVGASTETSTIEKCTAGIPSNAHKTGELAYLLNKYKETGETGWGQIIGTDAHPVALEDGKNNVYKYGKVQEATTLTLGTTADANRMTTLCFPDAVTLPDAVKAFTVTAMDASDITISKLDVSVVPAATPVILLNTGTAEASVPLSATNYYYSNSATPSVSQTGNLLIGTYTDITSELATVDPYTLVNSTFVRSSGKYPSAYQCYLDYSSGADIYTPAIAEYLEYPTFNNDYYEIYNVAQLKWFRDYVNSSTTYSSTNAKLMADIDLNYEDWTPIGDYSTYVYYKGVFDGNFHIISNLYVTSNNRYGGFIAYAFMGCLIKNLGIVNARFDDTVHLAGVVAGCVNDATIQGCWTSGDFVFPSSASSTAGIACGYSGTVINCHTSYSKVVDNDGYGYSYITPTNSTANIAANTGEMVCMLNKYKEPGETGWGQIIGTDLHPVALTKDNIVYEVYSGSNGYTVQNINETTVLGTNQLAFTDYSDVSLDVDNLVYDGKCKSFILNDAIDVYSPSAFTANEVEYNRTFIDNEFNSLYLPFSASVDDFTDCEFYVINMFHQYDTNNDGVLDAVSLEVSKIPDGSTLLANHPYLFKYKGDVLNDAVEFNLKNIGVEATKDVTFECSSMSYEYQFTGSFQGKTATEYSNYYVLGIDDASGKTVLAHPSGDLPAMRWAMKMTPRESQYGSTPKGAPAKVNIFVTGEDRTTGINSIGNDGANAGIYGVNGVRKSHMTEGVNIVRTADGKVVKVLKR